MILDKIDANGQIIKGKPQSILEESVLVGKVMAESVAGGDVELPLYVTESGYKPEDAAHLKEVVIASYTTRFSSGVVGRSKNIQLSAQAINNVIVGTQDIFSFNTTVGPSDTAHGYQPAKEIVNKKLVDGIGGGICQTSSTLYNAVDQVGVSYIEKHHHSLSVGYVPAGRDATVSYGGPDFRFKNTTGVPFMITTVYGKGSITVQVRTSRAYQSLLAKKLIK
jgi:vancomycin resistance protein YoaR